MPQMLRQDEGHEEVIMLVWQVLSLVVLILHAHPLQHHVLGLHGLIDVLIPFSVISKNFALDFGKELRFVKPLLRVYHHVVYHRGLELRVQQLHLLVV